LAMEEILGKSPLRGDKFLSLLDEVTEALIRENLRGTVQRAGKVLDSAGGDWKKAVQEINKGLSLVGGLAGLEEPSGCIRQDIEKIWEEYERRKDPRQHSGVKTGLFDVDVITGGGKPGELWLVAGFAGEGKSSLLVGMAWDACVMQGLNVVVGTAEMPRRQYQRRVLARHSMHDRFQAMGHGGIDSRKLRDGRLSGKDEEFLLNQVMPDFRDNPHYGRFEVMQLPREFTVEYLDLKLREYHRRFGVDVFYLDYLLLGRPTRKYGSRDEEAAGMFRDLKQLALNFDRGKGLFVVTAHQLNRESRRRAEVTKSYDLWSLAITSEAERSADVVLWVLRLDSHKSDRVVLVGMVKNRDGELLREPIVCRERFECSFLEPNEEALGEHFDPGRWCIGSVVL
jgi:replicative DNA helicase